LTRAAPQKRQYFSWLTEAFRWRTFQGMATVALMITQRNYLSEVRYVGPKPTEPAEFPNGKNSFAVKAPAPSVALYRGRLKCFFLFRWHWWKARHTRRENLLKYGKPKNEKA
jgi:hypothetical protein